MIFQHRHDPTITYVADVIKYSDGSYIYYVEGLGQMDPEFWEAIYERIEGRTGAGQQITESGGQETDRDESDSTDEPSRS